MSIKNVIGFVSLLMVFLVGISLAQTDPKPEQKLEIPQDLRLQPVPMNQQSLLNLRRRLIELDRLLILGSASRAESLLKELEQHSALRRELVTRRIRLAQLKEDHPEAVRLCQEALAGQARNPGLWRSLAESQLAIDQPDSALMSIGRFIDTNPNGRSATMVRLRAGASMRIPVRTARVRLIRPRSVGAIRSRSPRTRLAAPLLTS